MKPSPHVRSSVTGDGIILLDIRTGQIFSANPVAARIWSGLEQGQSMPSIVDGLVSDLGADRAIAERDVADFVGALRAKALVGDR